MVLLTGVGGSSSRYSAIEKASLSRRTGVHIAAVAIGNWLDMYEIDNVVSQPYSLNVITVNRFEQLSNNTIAQTNVVNIIQGSESLCCDYLFIHHKDMAKY
jgi:hypothetical protein